MGNCCCCCRERKQSTDELVEKMKQEREHKIKPGPISEQVNYRIKRDRKLRQEDKLKPPVTDQDYKIDDELKIPKKTSKEFDEEMAIMNQEKIEELERTSKDRFTQMKLDELLKDYKLDIIADNELKNIKILNNKKTEDNSIEYNSIDYNLDDE